MRGSWGAGGVVALEEGYGARHMVQVDAGTAPGDCWQTEGGDSEALFCRDPRDQRQSLTFEGKYCGLPSYVAGRKGREKPSQSRWGPSLDQWSLPTLCRNLTDDCI
jgi:hypothetical protein